MADNRDPDAIQREIEATRAELADTIDAIADRVSPRKAASRSAAAVKAQVSAALGHAEKAASDVGSKVKEAAPGAPEKEPIVGPAQVEQADSGRMEPGKGVSALDETRPITVNGMPAAVLDATPEQADRRQPVATLHQRSLRTDRVLVSVGVAAAAVGLVVLLRSRRH